MWFVVACVIGIVLLFVWIDLLLRKWTTFNLVSNEHPNYPKQIPRTLPDPLLEFGSLIYRAGIIKETEPKRLERLLQNNLHNPVKAVCGTIFGRPYIATWNPELIKQVLIKDQKIWVKAKLFESFEKLFAHSVFAVEGETWKIQRKILSPSFHFEHIKQLAPSMLAIADTLVERMRGFAREQEKFHPHPWMSKMTLDVIGKAGFGFDFFSLEEDKMSEEYDAYNNVMEEMMNVFRLLPGYERLPTKRNRDYEMHITRFMTWAKKMVDRKREQLANRTDDSVDLLDLMVSAHDDSGLSDIELLHNIFLFFLAGHETTSGTLTSALHFLANNPDVQKQCRDEVDTLFNGENPTYDSVKNLNVINLLINETMRLKSTVRGLSRQAEVDCTIGGYAVPKGTLVFVQSHVAHYDPDTWGPEPAKFDLGHWTPEKVKARPASCYLPFGSGSRICLGSSFANLEMRIALVKFLQNFEFYPTSEWVSSRSLTEQPTADFTVGIRLRTL